MEWLYEPKHPTIEMMYQLTNSCRAVFQVSNACMKARKTIHSKQYREGNTHELHRKCGVYVNPVSSNLTSSVPGSNTYPKR